MQQQQQQGRELAGLKCRYKEALECFNAVAADDKHSINLDIAFVEVRLERYESALRTFERVRDFAVQHCDSKLLGYALVGIGKVYNKQGKIREAHAVFNMAQAVPESGILRLIYRERALNEINICTDLAMEDIEDAIHECKYKLDAAKCYYIRGLIHKAKFNHRYAWFDFSKAFMHMVHVRNGSYHDEETCSVLEEMARIMLKYEDYKHDAKYLLRQVYIVYKRTFDKHSKIDAITELFGTSALPTEPVELADVLAVIQSVDIPNTCCSIS